ncbi:toxin glutamine deamidase domain-containing protein [Curtobacterium poinsettiae]|uniref:toxin glutamine deamidase domain-containing protein n=1 Tax=Curtobacterium poinsettiae TaxID=159612 RepID=UPI0039A1D65D
MDNGARDRTWGGMMGRPSGWDVVDQGDDPVKGDPSTLRMMAREYQRISDAADDASTRLKSVKGSGWLTDWEGEAADVFVDAIEDTPSDLTKLVDSYELAATALSGWADTVDDTQYRADGALADAKDATGDLAAAQDRLADAQSNLSHYQSASKDLSKVADKYPAGSDVPDGVDVPSPAQLRAASDNASVAQGSVSSAQGDISAAQSRIDAAKRLVADAKGDWQDAEQRTATKIGEAADEGLGKQSTWDKIFGSEAWETIVSVAKVVVAVGGIIAMIIPGPWTLVIAAIALVVLADTLYKMSKGEADGWDLAFALVDCVPAAGALSAGARTAKFTGMLTAAGDVTSGTRAVRSLNAGVPMVRDLATSVPRGLRRAIHADSADPQVLRSVFEREYGPLKMVNAERLARGVDGFSMNCTRCVIATEHVLDGKAVSAMPVFTRGASVADVAEHFGKSIRDFQPVRSYDSIVARLESAGEGARGVVFGTRAGTNPVGHVFNVVHDRNGVVFLDGQSGTFAKLENFDQLFLLKTR